MICWLNGDLRPIEEARIDPRDRGFLLGDGVFETVLAVDGVVRHAARHLVRMSGACDLLGIAAPYPESDILAAMGLLLHENHLLGGRAALRLTLTRGAGARGVAAPAECKPTVLLTAHPAPPPPQNMRVIISTYVRNEKSISSRIKSLNYLDNIMARTEAVQRGVDEALMRNSKGNLASASSANIFVVAGDALYTPPVSDGALPGIMRSIVLEAASELKIPFREGSIATETLATAPEAFLTNALIGVCPLIEIDGGMIGNGAAGPITGKIQAISKDRE